MSFFSFRFCLDLSKIFQNDFNDARTTKVVLNVIYRIINRMFVVIFFGSILDFVNLKNLFRISNLFFEIIRFIQNFEQVIFAFVLVFSLVFNLKFEILFLIYNAIDVLQIKDSKKTFKRLFRKKSKIVISKTFSISNNKFSSKMNFKTQRLHIYLDEFEFNLSFLSIKKILNVREKDFFNAFFDISLTEKFYVMKHSNKFILYAKIKLINNFFI